MKIGILGTGHIGTTLTQRLSATGHDVKVANSRAPPKRSGPRCWPQADGRSSRPRR